MALGYFFLAVFCVFTSAQSFIAFRTPLLIAALVAALAGLGFLASACSGQLQAAKKWVVHLLQIARQPPVHRRDATEEHTV